MYISSVETWYRQQSKNSRMGLVFLHKLFCCLVM